MIATNNPFDLRNSFSIRWQGQTGQTAGFCDFDTLLNGARAGCVDLKNAQLLHGLNTIGTIIPHYAPPNENDTQAYVADVCADMGIGPDTPVELTDNRQLEAFAAAVWHHEQGAAPDMGILSVAVNMALA